MSLSTQSFQVFLFLPLHLTPATSTFLQANTQSSTLLRSQMLQTTSICHASPHPPHSVHPEDCTQIHTAFPILQRHPTHPSHHHPFGPLQTLQICRLHHPGFRPICQYTLETSLVDFSLYYYYYYYYHTVRFTCQVSVQEQKINCPRVHSDARGEWRMNKWITCRPI